MYLHRKTSSETDFLESLSFFKGSKRKIPEVCFLDEGHVHVLIDICLLFHESGDTVLCLCMKKYFIREKKSVNKLIHHSQIPAKKTQFH